MTMRSLDYVIKPLFLGSIQMITTASHVQEQINVNRGHEWPLLLTWINFNPTMDK